MPKENNDAKTVEDSSTTTDAKGAESSTANTDAKPAESMLSVLQKTMEKHVEGSSTNDDKKEEEEQSTSIVEEDGKKPEDGDKPEDEQDDEKHGEDDTVETDEQKAAAAKKVEEENQRLDKLPRFRELNDKVKALTPDADFGKGVQSFLKQKGVGKETFDQALQVCALLVNDPFKAYEVLAPIMENLKKVTGDTLEPDLAKAVAEGEMTEQWAKQHQRQRNEHKIGSRQSALSESQRTQQAYVDTMNGWVADKMRTDPSYKQKTNGDADGLFEVTEAFFARACSVTPPKSPQESVKLAEASYKQAKEMFSKRLTPAPVKKKVLRTTPTGGAGAQEPKSLADVIKASYDKHVRN